MTGQCRKLIESFLIRNQPPGVSLKGQFWGQFSPSVRIYGLPHNHFVCIILFNCNYNQLFTILTQISCISAAKSRTSKDDIAPKKYHQQWFLCPLHTNPVEFILSTILAFGYCSFKVTKNYKTVTK